MFYECASETAINIYYIHSKLIRYKQSFTDLTSLIYECLCFVSTINNSLLRLDKFIRDFVQNLIKSKTLYIQYILYYISNYIFKFYQVFNEKIKQEIMKPKYHPAVSRSLLVSLYDYYALLHLK